MGWGPCKTPEPENETLKEIKRRLEEQEELLRETQASQKKEAEERQEQERKRKEEEEKRRRRDKEERKRRDEQDKARRKEEELRMQAKLQKLEQEATEARRREEKIRKDLAEQQRRTDEMAKIQLEQQTNDRKRREREANEAKRREEESRREVEEKLRRADEEKAAYQRQLKQQEDEAKRRETEVIEARDRRNREVEEQQRQADKQLAAAMQKKLQAEQKLSEGIQPLLWPTQEQVDAAKDRVQYDPERLHFAVCGPSGSGKSSLINAFRGLKSGEEGAAEVGNNETTLEVTRYQDPRKEMPYPRFVWCDIPGAGTIEISAWQYFNQQGLFIFDFIILVYGGRFTQIDVDILENCRRFRIPTLIVRSKASQQIRNSMQDNDCTYEKARDMYIESTQAKLQSNLQKAGLWKSGEGDPPSCYIVSRECVYDYIHSIDEDRWEKKNKTKIAQDKKKGGYLTEEYIDEVRLIHDLLQTAYQRRYIPNNRTAAILFSAAAASKTIGSAATKTFSSAASKLDGFIFGNSD